MKDQSSAAASEPPGLTPIQRQSSAEMMLTSCYGRTEPARTDINAHQRQDDGVSIYDNFSFSSDLTGFWSPDLPYDDTANDWWSA